MTTTDPAVASQSWGEPRSKTVSWYDPMRALEAGQRLSGLEYLTAMAEGTLPAPPIGGLLGFRPVSVSSGDIVFRCTPDESTYNPIGVVHGGLACTLLDSAAACAVHTTLPAGTGYTSVEIKVSYLRPIHAHTGELTAHGWVTKPGKRVAFAEADLRDGDGTVLATASTTCLIISG
jgi:uncharacterized protein (TIGR00369 family)